MLDKIMKSLSGHPAAAQLKAIAEAEARATQAADRLQSLIQTARSAKAELDSLSPEGLDTDADLEAAAGAYVQRHAAATARLSFAKAAHSKLSAELAEARRIVVDSEKQAAAKLSAHLHAAAEARAAKIADSIRSEVQLLAAELSRADGYAVSIDSALGYVQRIGWPNGWRIGVAEAEALISKPAPVALSSVITSAHRAGRDLDKLASIAPEHEPAVLRSKLAEYTALLAEARADLHRAESSQASAAVIRERREMVDRLEQSLGEVQAEQQRQAAAAMPA